MVNWGIAVKIVKLVQNWTIMNLKRYGITILDNAENYFKR